MEWFKLKNYEKLYEITKDGKVRRIAFDKIRTSNTLVSKLPILLKPQYDKDGYLRVTLYDGKVKKCKYVHRLVAETFIPNPNNYEQVNHKNGIKDDNRVENLEWCSQSYNIRHRIDVLGVSLKNNRRSKQVEQRTMDGELIKTYPSSKEAMRQTGFSQGHISEVCRGELKSYKNFIWNYKVK